MKVINFTSGFDINYPGGITNYVRDLHLNLINKSIDSKIISAQMEGVFSTSIKPDFEFYVDKYRRFSYKFCKANKDDDALEAYILQENPDVIHFHSIYGVSERFINFIINSKFKYVISLHDYYLVCPRIFMMDCNGSPCRRIDLTKCKKCISSFENIDFIRKLLGKLKIKAPKMENQYLNRRANLISDFFSRSKKILPVSKGVEKIFSDFLPSPNYLTLNIGNASADNFAKKEKSLKGSIEVAFLGTLNKHKGAELFIDIASKVKNELINFCFYGRADKYYSSLLAVNNIKNNGPYSPSNLSKILCDIDLGFVLPIWEDNGPQVVMELLNNGVPVVGTQVGGIPDFIQHLKTGYLFHPDSLIEIENTISWLNSITIDDVYNLSGNIKRLKTVDEHSQELIDIYNEL
ncbi:glycosyltransferase [Tolumonas lignilytica]|uniref:glycosyltransferase n=1 Tax=Tolumonas lignilytica TaxID=1283284 RepID=UPI000464EB63|nr:glycosyltransferase [Tolumonas lignilytica]